MHTENSKIAPQVEYDIEGILGRADFELEKLKRSQGLSEKSKYYKSPEGTKCYTVIEAQAKCGFSYSSYSDPTLAAYYADFERQFEWFCNQTTNKKGMKIPNAISRKKLLNKNYNFGNGGQKESVD